MNLRNAITLPAIALFCLSFGLRADDSDNAPGYPKNVVYVQTNDYFSGQNSVLAYKRDPISGALTRIGSFDTGGAGFHNSTDALGPDDTDQEIVATPDHSFLYVTNQGSDTIAGFAIQPDGSLKTLPGSPYPSGGVEPASIGIDGPLLFVVNRGNQSGASPGSVAPNYATFAILPDGALLRLPVPEPALTPGAAPTQALISPNGRLMFDTHLFENKFDNTGLPPFVPPFSSELHSYRIGPFGQLIPADRIGVGQPPPPPAMPYLPFILGLQAHPTKQIVYAGYVVSGFVATYSYDDDGNMTFVGATATASPISGICWFAIGPDAAYLYTADAITNQVDVFSIADPLNPVHVQAVTLLGGKTPGPPFTVFPTTPNLYDTNPFQLRTSPDGQFLFVVNHEVADLIGGSSTGNALHVLKIAPNGTLTEVPTSPRYLTLDDGVPITVHPLGVVVF